MPPEKPLTPEKQLLKLIEDPSAKNSFNTAALKHQGLSLFSPRVWISRGSFIKHKFQKWAKAPKGPQLDIKTINRILEVMFLVLGFCLIGTLYTSALRFKKAPDFKVKALQKTAQSENLQDSSIFKTPLAHYLEKISARDIFKMGPKKRETPPLQNTGNAQGSRILEATQHLKLVGISWSNDPDAMIEDTRAIKTFFVKRGQMIGDIRVQAIFKDKVILTYSGEEIELK